MKKTTTCLLREVTWITWSTYEYNNQHTINWQILPGKQWTF